MNVQLNCFMKDSVWDDLKRWKTAETEMPQDLLGIKMERNGI